MSYIPHPADTESRKPWIKGKRRPRAPKPKMPGANTQRAKIMQSLADGEKSMRQIAEHVAFGGAAMSMAHANGALLLLVRKQLIRRRHDGRVYLYSLPEPKEGP